MPAAMRRGEQAEVSQRFVVEERWGVWVYGFVALTRSSVSRMKGRGVLVFVCLLAAAGCVRGWAQVCHGADQEEQRLITDARSILSGNWLPDLNTTLPSPNLYPHQWSWDSAFIAIGYAHYDLTRAMGELRALFKGQWASGLLPHIIFSPGTSASYFPGPTFWKTDVCDDSVHAPETSGIVQPPVHAIAALKIYKAGGDKAFLEEIYPKLLAWHDYLYRERDPRKEHLVYIRHPWESGMDNSPAWDKAFDRITLKKGDVPPYERKDNKVHEVKAEDRPTDYYYDRYVYLIKVFYDNEYNETKISEKSPFLIQDVLFNAILSRAEDDLAIIAQELGLHENAEMSRKRAASTHEAILTKLWSAKDAAFFDYDLHSDELVRTKIGGGMAGIFGVTLPESELRGFLNLIDSEPAKGRFGALNGYPVPTVLTTDHVFVDHNYWRGPVWVNINYLLIDGLLQSGSERGRLTARYIHEKTIDLVKKSGFFEFFSPLDASPHGAGEFSWTASLVIDMLCDEDRLDELYTEGKSGSTWLFFSGVFVALVVCAFTGIAFLKQTRDRQRELQTPSSVDVAVGAALLTSRTTE